MEKEVFPLYRMYPNGMSYFKIESHERFIEWKRTGHQWEKHTFEAKILPDRNFIQDMINMHNGHWVATSKEAYTEIASTA